MPFTRGQSDGDSGGNLLVLGSAKAQLLDRYFPANVPAYQDWAISTSGPPIDLGYAPIGIWVGSFVFYPSITQTVGYGTNPYGTEDSVASAFEETNSMITANSNWSRNSLNAYLNVADTQYFKTGQSLTDWTASWAAPFRLLTTFCSSVMRISTRYRCRHRLVLLHRIARFRPG